MSFVIHLCGVSGFYLLKSEQENSRMIKFYLNVYKKIVTKNKCFFCN